VAACFQVLLEAFCESRFPLDSGRGCYPLNLGGFGGQGLFWVDGVYGDDVYCGGAANDGSGTCCGVCCNDVPSSAAVCATSGRDWSFWWKALRPRDYGFELGAWAKLRDEGSFLGDVLSGLRVVHVACRPAAPFENAESGNGDAIACVYRPYDLVYGGAQQGGRFLTIGAQFSGEFIDELCFVHCLGCFPVSGRLAALCCGRNQMLSGVA